MWQQEADSASSERLIVNRIAAGDEDAFALAYDRYADLLYGSLVRFTGDRETAAEIVQDTFMTLWRRAAQFDNRLGNLPGWLMSIARHRAVDRHRAAGRRPVSAFTLDSERSVAGGHRTADADSDPEHVAGQRWLQAVVRTAVSELPDEQQSVVLMAYSEGLSQSEISGRTGIPLGTVKSRTRRAMAHLRGRLSAWPGLADVLAVAAPMTKGED